jgi:glutamate decarboxylase
MATKHPQRRAEANLDSMRRVFSIPETDDSTLLRIEREISSNLLGYLKEHFIASPMEPQELERDFEDVVIPEEPMFVSDQAEFLLNKVVAKSVHTAAPSFIGHMTSSMPYFMLPLAKIMIALNQNTVKIETSKSFTPLESQVVGMLHRLVYGQDDAFYKRWTHDHRHALGVFTSGGTIANVTGLWVARNKLLTARGAFQGVFHDGLAAGLKAHDLENLCVLVSKRGHYSLQKSADLLGLGRRQLIAVDVDPHQKMDLAALKKTILECRKKKIGVLAVVGIAGTTETGHVDPLKTMAEICHEFSIHFHVDGAWGAPTLFSEKHRGLLAGIELADSVVIDAHKQLYVPMGAGLCIFKDVTSLDAIQTNAQYIIREGSRDLGQHTLEGSKPGMSMLVHSGLRILGRKGYELLIDLGIGKAQQFAKQIQMSEDFELTTEPELNILTYRYLGADVKSKIQNESLTQGQRRDLNELLSELVVNIQKEQRDRGKSFVSRTRFEMAQHQNQALTVFRVVIANPLTTRQVFVDVLNEQRDIAAEEKYKMNFNERYQKIFR